MCIFVDTLSPDNVITGTDCSLAPLPLSAPLSDLRPSAALLIGQPGEPDISLDIYTKVMSNQLVNLYR